MGIAAKVVIYSLCLFFTQDGYISATWRGFGCQFACSLAGADPEIIVLGEWGRLSLIDI